MFSREAANTNFIVFDLTLSGIEPAIAIYHTGGEHANHYTTEAVMVLYRCAYICKHGGRFLKWKYMTLTLCDMCWLITVNWWNLININRERFNVVIRKLETLTKMAPCYVNEGSKYSLTIFPHFKLHLSHNNSLLNKPMNGWIGL